MSKSSSAKSSGKEQWKLYHFKNVPKASQQIDVSNLGRVRSNSQVSKGAILKGSLTEGYRKISLRVIHPRSKAGLAQFLKNKSTLAELKNNWKQAAESLAVMKKKKQAGAERQAVRVKNLKQELEQQTQAYRKKLQQDEHSRTTFPGALVHRMVAEMFCKRPSPRHEYVIHLDHNRLNNHAKNLAWATKEQMEKHQLSSPYVKAAKKAMIGRRSGTYALNESKVRTIKRLLSKGSVTKEQIAGQFGISSTQVKRIERGENWGDVKV